MFGTSAKASPTRTTVLADGPPPNPILLPRKSFMARSRTISTPRGNRLHKEQQVVCLDCKAVVRWKHVRVSIDEDRDELVQTCPICFTEDQLTTLETLTESERVRDVLDELRLRRR